MCVIDAKGSAASRVAVSLTGALKVFVSSSMSRYRPLCRLPLSAIGYLHCNANSVQHNAQLVGLYSTAFAAAHGVAVQPHNYTRVCTVFAARRLIARTFTNWCDEYAHPHPKPNEEMAATTTESPQHRHNEMLRRFVLDAIIYTLFETKSNQSSLRKVHCVANDSIANCPNQWFWQSREFMCKLAKQHGFHELVEDLEAHQEPKSSSSSSSSSAGLSSPANDVQNEGERFVYGVLQMCEKSLSAEARELLMFANDTLIKTMQMRVFIFNRYRELCSRMKPSLAAPILEGQAHRDDKVDDDDDGDDDDDDMVKAVILRENLHLESWDAGWYQIRRLVKLNSELVTNRNGGVAVLISHAEFISKWKTLLRKLEARMRPCVFELNMLPEHTMLNTTS